ncbi:hypothetical protein PANI_CDS0048 [Maribacter phage Panino]
MKIALDIDDVLAGYANGVHEAFNVPMIPHNHWNPNESTGLLLLKTDDSGKVVGYTEEYLDKCEHNKDFWYHLEPISLPVDIPYETCCYITSSPRNMVDVRMEWLKKHGFPRLPVIHSKDKAITMNRLRIDLLIDDKLPTVEDVRGYAGTDAIHFKPWYSTLREKKSITHLNQYKS